MDWLKSSLASAQKQAQEAAERAKVLAAQASQQAKAFAAEASEKATHFAEQASEKAKELAHAAAEEAQHKYKELASGNLGLHAVDNTEECLKFGVTPGVVELASAMGYSTFSDFDTSTLPSTNPLGLTTASPGPDFRLSPYQEKHALLLLQKAENLNGLRFALCPKRMTEEQFWVIYFTLVKKVLPPEAFGLPPLHRAGSSGFATSSRQPLDATSTSGFPARSEGWTTATALSGVSISTAEVINTPSSKAGEEAELLDALSGSLEEDDLDQLAELENDPELAAYLQEALDVDDAGEGELSELGSGVDDLDDYINQLDAELKEEGEEAEDKN